MGVLRAAAATRPAGNRHLARQVAGGVRRARPPPGHRPLLDAVIDEADGCRIRIEDRWLADFASCNNYLLL